MSFGDSRARLHSSFGCGGKRFLATGKKFYPRTADAWRSRERGASRGGSRRDARVGDAVKTFEGGNGRMRGRCAHRETAVDLLGGLGEARLPVEGLAELLDEEHLGSGSGHLVGAEELEALGEGLDAEVGDELGHGGAAVSLGHDVLEVAEADLAHDVLLLGGGGAAERALGGAAGGAGGLGGGHGARGEDEGVESESGHRCSSVWGGFGLRRVSDQSGSATVGGASKSKRVVDVDAQTSGSRFKLTNADDDKRDRNVPQLTSRMGTEGISLLLTKVSFWDRFRTHLQCRETRQLRR